MNRSLKKSIVTLYVMGFFHNFMVVVPMFVPLLQRFGLSMAEVLQTQAVFALTIALFEVPSGYCADLWGRKRALMLGSLFNGLGFLWLMWADTFVDFLIFETILGVGLSLISGADLAIIYDTEIYLAQQGAAEETDAAKSLSRLISIEALASAVAGIVASVMLLWSMDALVQAQALAGFIPFLLSFALVEPPQERLQQSHAGNARTVLDLLLFGKPVVLWTTVAIVAFGLLSLYSFWTYQKYFELTGIPVAYFGYLWAGFALVISLMARYTGVIEQALGTRRLLGLVALLPLLGLMGMALTSGWIGVVFCLAIQVSRGLSLTLFYEALNRRIPGDFRATVNSLVSLALRAVFIVTGPVLGYLLDTRGMTTTLIGLVLVFLPAFVLIIVGLNTRIRRESVHDAAQVLA